MLDTIEKPLFIVAFILLAIAVLIEVGSLALLGSTIEDAPRPGLAISYLALVDGLLLYTLALIGLGFILPGRVHGSVQGIMTFIVSLLALIGSIILTIVAIALLILMVSLLLAVPFGTIAYFAAYSTFKVGAAAGTLSLVMILKLFCAGFMVFSYLRFLQNRGLIFLFLTSFLATIIISFLHGFVPGFLASITDAIAAIVVAILAIIWALLLFIGSVPAIIKVLRVDRAIS